MTSKRSKAVLAPPSRLCQNSSMVAVYLLANYSLDSYYFLKKSKIIPERKQTGGNPENRKEYSPTFPRFISPKCIKNPSIEHFLPLLSVNFPPPLK